MAGQISLQAASQAQTTGMQTPMGPASEATQATAVVPCIHSTVHKASCHSHQTACSTDMHAAAPSAAAATAHAQPAGATKGQPGGW